MYALGYIKSALLVWIDQIHYIGLQNYHLCINFIHIAKYITMENMIKDFAMQVSDFALNPQTMFLNVVISILLSD